MNKDEAIKKFENPNLMVKIALVQNEYVKVPLRNKTLTKWNEQYDLQNKHTE